MARILDKLSRIPMGIRAVYAVDLFLGFAFLLCTFGPNPSTILDETVRLHGESSIPTWYSSTKLFVIAVVVGCAALRASQGRSVLRHPLTLFALVFLFMSMDEVAMFHERLGGWADYQFLPGRERHLTPLPYSGLWPVLVIPFLALLVPLILRLRKTLPGAGRAMRLFAIGFLVFLGGATVVEFLGNFVIDDRAYLLLEIWLEESLEMIGASTMLWGALELARSQGLDAWCKGVLNERQGEGPGLTPSPRSGPR